MKEEVVPQSLLIYKPDGFWSAIDSFVDYFNKIEPENDVLRVPKYSSSDLKISRRMLSHWRKIGLLDESETTKLSYIDCFWLSIANELRSFGLSLEKLKRVKDTIFNVDEEPLLAFALYCSLRKDINDDYFLIVNSKGDADIGTNDEIFNMESLNILDENYIKINFNIIHNKFTKKQIPTLKNDYSGKSVSPEERQIIDAVRSGEYKKVSIRFKNGIATHLEKESVNSTDVMLSLKKAISEQSFGNITLTQKDGKIIHMQNTATVKL